MVPLAGYAGVVAMLCLFAALNAHKLPKFSAEAFLARPPEEQRRSIRNVRVLLVVAAALCMAAAFGIGFIRSYGTADAEAKAVRAMLESVQSESQASDIALATFEASMQPAEAESLLTPEGLAANRKQVAEWSRAVDRWETSKKELVPRIEEAISKLEVRQSLRDEILAGFRSGNKKSDPLRADYAQAKRDAIVALGQRLDLVQSRRDKIKIAKGGELVFTADADARHYQAIEARLEAASQREEAAAKTLLERAVAAQDTASQALGK